jgi:hypothetical protein
MKRIKMALTAIAVVGLVSGALAFKSAKGNGNLFCNATVGSTCPTTADYVVVAPLGSDSFCGVAGSADCQSDASLTHNTINVGQ